MNASTDSATGVTPQLEGRRVLLRAVTPADVGARYCAWLNDPTINRFLETRHEVQTLDSVRRYVEAMRADPRQNFWAICVEAGARHIGNIKLGPINAAHGHADVSVFLGEKDCWGHGYATEAIALVARFAFQTLQLNKLKAGAYRENVASIRAFEKCGFRQEGALRRHLRSDEGYTDMIVLGRLRDDPAPDAAP